MHVVCYFSQAAHSAGAHPPLHDLVADCAAHAQRHGLTGLLAVADGYFLHFVEGERAAIDGLIDRIQSFWDHASPTVLFEREASERLYPQWSASLAQRPHPMADMAQRLGHMREFMVTDTAASPSDLFRYFLTPSRAAPAANTQPAERGPVRKVAIFSSSVLWFNPIFSHVGQRFQAQPSALKISSTALDADTFALDYADVVAPEIGAARLVGISQDLLASTLSSPLLHKVELVVFLMRRSGAGGDTHFVANALAYPEVAKAKPGVLFITPGVNADLSEALETLARDAGMESMEHVGSVLVGGPIWDAIHDWLSAHPPQAAPDQAFSDTSEAPRANEPAHEDFVQDGATSPFAFSPMPAPEHGGDVASGPSLTNAAPDPKWATSLARAVQGLPAAAWGAWLDTTHHRAVALSSEAPTDPATLDAVMASARLDIATAGDATGALEDVIASFAHRYHLTLAHPTHPSMVLWVQTPRTGVNLAVLRRHLREVVDMTG